MRITIRLIASLILICSVQSACTAQSALLDNATHFAFDTPVNDVVYDSVRNVLYASIPSSAGSPLGNTIATIDPETGALLDSIFVGSEPNKLGISADASHVFVGIDGARSVRTWQPATGSLSALTALVGRFGDQAVAHDFAVLPDQPSVAVVSADEVGSTANGTLVLVDGSGLTQLDNGFNSPNQIDFISPTILVGFDDSNTGFEANRWELDGTELTLLDSQSGVVNSFDVEAEASLGGLLYFSDGTLVDPETLNLMGTFNTGLSEREQLVEAVPELDLVYFVAPSSSGDVVLSASDLNTFLTIDSIALPIATSTTEDRGELIVAGTNRLAFVWKPQEFDGPGGSGILNIVSGIPTTVEVAPEVASVELNVGEEQRSAIETITIAFDSEVTLADGAVSFLQRSTATAETFEAVTVSITEELVDDQTFATIQFESHVRNSNNALVDGNYQLTIDASLVTKGGVPMDDDFVLGAVESDGLFSFYGDGDGNRTVNVFDLLTFRQTYLLSSGDSNYDFFMDFDASGIINVIDLLQFRIRFQETLPFTFGSGSSRQRQKSGEAVKSLSSATRATRK
jgi:hypothetical protein